jgi:branched-chain amino acid transport system permease protein
VQPDTVFDVQWSTYTIFIVIIGGIGYLEGPLVGSPTFFALQRWLADYGIWYLVLLGAIAVASAIWLPRGIWGLVSARAVRLFGAGYHLQERE